MASLTAVLVTPKRPVDSSPSKVIEPMMARNIRPQMSPYSIAVAPQLHVKNFFMILKWVATFVATHNSVLQRG